MAIVPVGALRVGPDLVTTAGSWERTDGGARFTPRFRPVPGTRLVALGRRDAAEEWRELGRIAVPGADLTPRAVVETIEPNVETVPANLLRFSVSFSAAMEDGSAAGRLRVLDESGAPIPGALLEMPPELWDRDRRRLTVLLEPGRIKRGLQPNVQAGAPLHEGSVITLVVESEIRDTEGSPLVGEARRRYRVGPAIRSRVDPNRWSVRWPDGRSNELVVVFDRPLDRALLQRYLRVRDRHGRPVRGHASLGDDSLRWVFTPVQAGGDWRLHVDARLEDLAGNSVRRVFDRDLQNRGDDGIDDAEVILSSTGAG